MNKFIDAIKSNDIITAHEEFKRLMVRIKSKPLTEDERFLL